MFTAKEEATVRAFLKKAAEKDLVGLGNIYREVMSEYQEETAYKFNIGDIVLFEDKKRRVHEGKITKINRKTIKVLVGNGTWTVSPSLLKIKEKA